MSGRDRVGPDEEQAGSIGGKWDGRVACLFVCFCIHLESPLTLCIEVDRFFFTTSGTHGVVCDGVAAVLLLVLEETNTA